MIEMKLTIKNSHGGEMLFFISYGILLLFSILSTSFYYKYFLGWFKYVLVFCAFLLIIQEVTKRTISIKSFIGLILCFILFVLMIRVSSGVSQNVAASVILYVYCGRDISFKKIAKFTIFVECIVLIFIILSAEVGIITNYIRITNSHARTREYLGFRYALYPSTFMFNITCLSIYLKNKKMKYTEVIALFIANFWMFLKTNSRITFALATVLLLYTMITKLRSKVHNAHVNNNSKFINILTMLLPLSFVICAIVSIGLTIKYSSSTIWMRKLNDFLSGRLALGKASLMLHGIPLLGQNVSWIGNGLDAYGNPTIESYTWVDSFYIQVLQRYGFIFFIVFIIVITIALLKIRKSSKSITLLLIMATIAAHCIIDDLSIYFYYNTFWLLIGHILIPSKFHYYENDIS